MAAYIVRGNVITMDPDYPRAEAFSIRDGRIVHVGSYQAVHAAAGADADVIAISNGAIIPGLIDTHNHMLSTGIQRRIVDLSACQSIADIAQTVRDFAEQAPAAEWIISGKGWQIETFPDPRYPTCRELDEACADRPVYLNRGGHIGVVNSKALAIAGIDRNTPDPEGGRIVRDENGDPTGVLLEAPAFSLVDRHAPAPSREERKAALKDVQQLYHAAGLCGVIDPGLNADDMSIYQELWQTDELTMRTVAMPLAQTADEADQVLANLAAWGVRTGFGDDRLKLGGIKVFMDGGASLGTALMRRPFPDERCNCGIQVTHTSTFHRIVEFCARNRWSLGVHAVGGGAIDLTLEVFAEVDARYPIRDLRFSLIHAYLWPTADNIATARRLGVAVATQPTMQYNFAPMLVKRFGAESFGRATPIKSWLDGGIRVGGGSDSPVNPYPPLLGIWHAITRYVDDLQETIGSQQAINPEAALAMYTRDAAWLAFSEHERGMIRPGMLADWVALSVDPLTCPPMEIRDARVLRTVVGGKTVYQAPGR
jgi:predicted amidohydrolase YtcJ